MNHTCGALVAKRPKYRYLLMNGTTTGTLEAPAQGYIWAQDPFDGQRRLILRDKRMIYLQHARHALPSQLSDLMMGYRVVFYDPEDIFST